MARRRTDGEMLTTRRIEHRGAVSLVVEHDVVDLDALIRRARDLRPAFETVISGGELREAKAYERDDRFRGGLGRADRDGIRRNWGKGGYGAKLRGLGRTKRTLSARFARPYPPALAGDTVAAIAETTLHFIVTGDAP